MRNPVFQSAPKIFVSKTPPSHRLGIKWKQQTSDSVISSSSTDNEEKGQEGVDGGINSNNSTKYYTGK